jgi:hypothetical protein
MRRQKPTLDYAQAESQRGFWDFWAILVLVLAVVIVIGIVVAAIISIFIGSKV